MVGLIRGMALKNCTFDFKNPEDKKKGLFFIDFKGRTEC